MYGLIAEFNSPHEVVQAAKATHAAGYRQLDAFSPIPVHGLAHAIGFKKNRIPLIVLISGLAGAALAHGLGAWVSVAGYPLNIGGRPLYSWPSFIPMTFEGMVLFAGFTAVIGTFTLSGLPRLNHPVFEVPQFANASIDKFFLLIKSSDPQFNPVQTRQFLEGLHAVSVAEVPVT